MINMKPNNTIISFYKNSKNGKSRPITKSKKQNKTMIYSTKKFSAIKPNSFETNNKEVSFSQKLEDELEKVHLLENQLDKLKFELQIFKKNKKEKESKKISDRIEKKKHEINKQLSIIHNLRDE